MAQVKSRSRVVDYGEVFTAEREVNAMLDLVKSETERIDSRFLEPACGDGNFLVEILRRKLAAVKEGYGGSSAGYERNAVLAITSIYGVDILQDNVDTCRDRLFKIWDEAYIVVCGENTSEETREAVRFIIERNILCGNTLTVVQSDADGNDTDNPIIFSEWSFVADSYLQRCDYRMDVLLADQCPLKPVHEFPAVHYREVQKIREKILR